MDAKKFRPGDKVRHKTGGQVMAVQGYSEETNMVICEWHHDGQFERSQFLEEVLEFDQPPTNEPIPIDDPLKGF